MKLIHEKSIDNSDMKEWKIISDGAGELPSGNANLKVMDRKTRKVMIFDYVASGRSTPIIRGKAWRSFVGRCREEGATIISLYKLDDASYEVEAR
ncbi:hypothetical protein PTKIN_Ptkin02bG0239200 [Pterospermum kingtungense]